MNAMSAPWRGSPSERKQQGGQAASQRLALTPLCVLRCVRRPVRPAIAGGRGVKATDAMSTCTASRLFTPPQRLLEHSERRVRSRGCYSALTGCARLAKTARLLPPPRHLGHRDSKWSAPPLTPQDAAERAQGQGQSSRHLGRSCRSRIARCRLGLCPDAVARRVRLFPPLRNLLRSLHGSGHDLGVRAHVRFALHPRALQRQAGLPRLPPRGFRRPPPPEPRPRHARRRLESCTVGHSAEISTSPAESGTDSSTSMPYGTDLTFLPCNRALKHLTAPPDLSRSRPARRRRPRGAKAPRLETARRLPRRAQNARRGRHLRRLRGASSEKGLKTPARTLKSWRMSPWRMRLRRSRDRQRRPRSRHNDLPI